MARLSKAAKAVLSLLESPASDVEELATQVVAAIDESRATKPGFLVVKATSDGKLMYAYGPFSTELQARKAVDKGLVPIIEGEAHGICRVYSERYAEKAQEAADNPTRLTLRNKKDVGRHPVPYQPDDFRRRRRYQNMTKQQKRAEYERRLA